ncbi:EF-hand calcium-binding domain-containing protein 13 [Nycticebus coucang]|uniref:EF-hand calcium-binding domain-containing protein 13 n=1 Tax=Nycticebus coucang TaxID=9470 RepID=UPI00234CE123|nr:EF-hand calcium-binding domain-containing protein 13 [Nycticebus coucang]
MSSEMGNPFVSLPIHTCSSRPLSSQGQNLPLNRKMETEVHLFCQAEENIDLSVDDSNSFVTNLPSRNIDSKKYVKCSKTIEKKISSKITGSSLEHKKLYEASLFLCKEEKFSDFSGGTNIKGKKSLQIQQHSKKSEILSPFLKLSKEKMTRKENSLCKFPNHYSVYKTSSPLCTSSSNVWKEEMISNLYLTLYEEVSSGCLYSQELSALQKACKIFSKIRSGKIYVNDLPIVLCTLRISVSDSEMRQALKSVAIDVNGILDFSNFLKAVNDVSYLVSQDPAFQDALKIFCRIKSGRIATDEIVAVLNSMDILISPETLKEVMKHTYTDSNHMVDVGDIILILNELQQQYEDVSIMEGSALDETTSGRKLSNTAECYVQSKKKNSFSPRPSELSISRKLNKKCHQYYSKIMEKNDDLEFKRPKSTWQEREFLDGAKSIDVGFQEPYSKNGINIKKHSDKGEIQDSKSKLQNLKSITSVNKSLDKSDISGISELQKPAVRRHSSLLKQVSPKEKTAINTLVLSDVIKAIDKIKDENVDPEDLNTCLQNFGIYLSKEEFEKIAEVDESDEIKKVNFKEFIGTMMRDTERFSEKLLLSDAIENLNNLSKEKIRVPDLWKTLSSLNSNLKKDEFLAALNQLTIDDGDTVQFEEFAKVVQNMCDASRLEELQEVVSAFDLIEGGMIAEKNLEDFLRNVGIKSPKEEAEKILQSNFVSEDNIVNVKDCLRALRDTQKFSNFIALNEAINTLVYMKESCPFNKDKHSDVLENTNRLNFTDDILKEIIDEFSAEGDKDKFYNKTINKNDVAVISDLQQNLNAIGICLTDDKIQEALVNTNPNDEVVHFKDFIRELANSDDFIECQRIEDAWNIIHSVSDGQAEIKDLSSTLKNLEKPLNEEQLKVLLNSATDEGKMILKVVSNLLTDSAKPSTPFNNLLKEITVLKSIRNDSMPANELCFKFLSAGIPLSNKAFQEILRQACIDENSEVCLKEILENLNTSKPDPVFEEIYTALDTVNLMNYDRIQVNDLENAFDQLGISLKPEEHQMLEKTLDADGIFSHYKLIFLK